MLQKAYDTWMALAPLRARRARYKRFTYGRQWDDPVSDPRSGLTVSERNLVAREGRQPLTNNLIRQLVKSIVGRFRLSAAAGAQEGRCPELEGIYRLNSLDELDSRLLEEFLISGMAVQRLCREVRDDGLDAMRVDNVGPGRFFVNLPRDPRGTDIETVGMLHDLTPEEVVMRWGGDDRSKARALLENLNGMMADSYTCGTPDAEAEPDFYYAAGGRVRVVEVWRREPLELYRVHDPETGTVGYRPAADFAALKTENGKRRRAGRPQLALKWEMSRRWVGRWYLADGTLLHTEKKQPGEMHPFVVKLYPLIDGEVHSLVEDVVDQQKYVNRLINLIDRMMATSAKGALLFPVESLPEGADFADIASQWSAVDGLVLYRSFPGEPEPRQLSTQVADIGAKDLLRIEMQLFKEISGVGDALLGRDVPAGVGVDRYEMQVQNASVAIRDLLDTFSSMLAGRDARLLGG